MIRTLCLLILALALAGCASKPAAKRYPMKGKVVSVDPAAKTATIDAGKIDGWMEAMTMEYSVKPETELAKLHAGDRIEATVVVEDDRAYITDVKVVAPQ